jgi:hypothetical protein
MAFLIVGGVTVPVSSGQATQRAPERAGTSMRMFDGSLRSTVRHEKASWSVVTTLLTLTDRNALAAVIVNGAFVSCSGDLLGGVTVECEGTLGDMTPVQTALGIRWRVSFILREV